LTILARKIRATSRMSPLKPKDRLRISATSPQTDEPEKACVIAALDLRDDRYHTNYFKILMRRRHLFQLFLILWISITLCLILSYFKFLPPPLNGTKLVAAVVLFGVLGACLSVAQGLLAANVSNKIPAQQIGSFVVWMRSCDRCRGGIDRIGALARE
jgi:hypothetical protein